MKRNLTTIQPKHKVILFITSTLLVILLFYFLWLVPQTQRIGDLSNQVGFEKQRNGQIESFALAHPNSDEYLLEVDQKVFTVNQLLPNELDVSDFLVQLNQTAITSGVRLVQIKPAQPVNKSGYREIPVEILIRGSYFQTLNFLTKFDNVPRFAMINNISTQSRQNILESKLSVSIYCYGVTQTQNSAGPAHK